MRGVLEFRRRFQLSFSTSHKSGFTPLPRRTWIIYYIIYVYSIRILHTYEYILLYTTSNWTPRERERERWTSLFSICDILNTIRERRWRRIYAIYKSSDIERTANKITARRRRRAICMQTVIHVNVHIYACVEY